MDECDLDNSDRVELENALSALSGSDHGSLLPGARETVADNFRRGRARKLIQARYCRTLAEYVPLVARTIRSEAEESRRLPEGDRPEEWWLLPKQKLRAQAYRQLLRLRADHFEGYQRAQDFP